MNNKHRLLLTLFILSVASSTQPNALTMRFVRMFSNVWRDATRQPHVLKALRSVGKNVEGYQSAVKDIETLEQDVELIKRLTKNWPSGHSYRHKLEKELNKKKVRLFWWQNDVNKFEEKVLERHEDLREKEAKSNVQQ